MYVLEMYQSEQSSVGSKDQGPSDFFPECCVEWH